MGWRRQGTLILIPPLPGIYRRNTHLKNTHLNSRAVEFFVAEPKQVLFTDYQVGHIYQVRAKSMYTYSFVLCSQLISKYWAKVNGRTLCEHGIK